MANPPTIPFIKPTKQMATYVATPNNFDAPFDAMQNNPLPFKHSFLYVAMPNTSSTIETTRVKAAKKSSESTPVRVPRANGPDSWARVRRRFALPRPCRPGTPPTQEGFPQQ
jgi:hypothetical protein